MTPNGEPPGSRQPPAPRRSLRIAAGLLCAEGLSGVCAGVGFAIAALVGHPEHRGVAVSLGVLLVIYGAAVVLVGRGVWRGARWARTPAYLVQFFGLVVAWYQRHTLLAVAIVVAVVSLAASALLVRATADRA